MKKISSLIPPSIHRTRKKVWSILEWFFITPRRILRLCDFKKYMWDTHSIPMNYHPTEAFMEKHNYVPKRLMQYAYWCAARWHVNPYVNRYEPIPFRDTSFRSAARWVADVTIYSNEYMLLEQVARYSVKFKEVIEGTDWSKYRVWMTDIVWHYDPRYPRVEALRYAYLLGDITINEYMDFFYTARRLDLGNFRPPTDGTASTTEIYYVAANHKPGSIAYVTVFGRQYDRPFKIKE